MESSPKDNPPCSSDAAACNPAAPVRPPVADPDTTSANWPRFLVIKSCDEKSILKHNLFIIAKAIEGIAGKPKETKALKNAGLLLIEVDRKHHATNLLKAKLLHNIPVEITPHRSMNSSKGVITCAQLKDMDDKDILQNLKESDQNVTDLYRISTFRNGIKTPTNTFVVTFNSTTPPERMYVGHYRVNVRLYIPNPRRCYKCQRYGHTTKFCQNDQICENCGKPGHENKDCSSDAVCANCNGSHKASSKQCSQWKFEKDIVEFKYKNNVSFAKSRKTIEALKDATSTSNTYAAVVTNAPKKSDMGIQTDLTWPLNFTSPILTADCLSSNVKSVQSATDDIENMESENSNSKRRCESCSSNEEDLPSLAKPPPQKKGNHFKNLLYKLEKSGVSLNRNSNERQGSSKESAAPREPGAPQEPLSPSPSGNSTTEGAKGDDWVTVTSSKNYSSRGRSRHRTAAAPPPPPASRSGSNASSRSETRRSRSPVKPP